MIGLVVSTWIKTSVKLYGKDKVDSALEKIGMKSDKNFSPMEVVDDEKVNAMIKEIAAVTDNGVDKIWEDIGSENLKVFAKQYPLFFIHKNVYGLLRSLNSIHKVIAERMPTSKPPLIEVTPIGSRTAIFLYKSKRGMVDYMVSMLKSAIKHYNENVNIEIVEKKDDTVKLKLTFDYEIFIKKTYWFNKLLSFGFIKSVEVKIAITTMVSLFLIHALVKYMLSIDAPFVEELLGTILVSAFTYSILSPLRQVKIQLSNLEKKDYLSDMQISTGDYIEEFSMDVRKVAKSFNDTLISMESVADEVKEFNDQFTQRLEGSSSIFNEINSAVEQVTQGAVQQSNEIEDTVKFLNENTNSLNGIVDEQNYSQTKLINVVGEIKENQSNIQETSSSIQRVTDSFAELNIKSSELQEEAKEILNIVFAVKTIAEETSLLSLNASIEAARAGESGKGFSVVASEIGKLSSNSKNSAMEIEQSLTKFIEKIRELIDSVNTQYDTLNNENLKLNNVSEKSLVTAKKIDGVMADVLKSIDNVKRQVVETEKIFLKADSLVSIGEENAAMAEEVSSSVNTYIEELNDIIKSVYEIKKITNKFSDTMDHYLI